MRIACPALLVLFLLAGLAAAEAPPVGIYADRLVDTNLVACPYCGRPIRTGTIHPDAEVILIDELRQGLADNGISYALARENARTIQAFIFKFQERRGSSFAVERPASVGFHFHLMDKERIVKVFAFEETQQPLSEDILKFGTFLRRGMRWVTARELAEEGVEKGLIFFQEDLK
jgi:hypothetical protein